MLKQIKTKMVNYIRLMELINKAFKEQYGYLANPRDYPTELKLIIETCADMLEEEANDHNDEDLASAAKEVDNDS